MGSYKFYFCSLLKMGGQPLRQITPAIQLVSCKDPDNVMRIFN